MQAPQPFLSDGIDVDGLTYIMLRNFSITLTELKEMKVRTVLKLVRLLEEELRQAYERA